MLLSWCKKCSSTFLKQWTRQRNNGQFYSSTGTGKRDIVRRALMYVPGNDEKKITKALNLDLDCVILDCEDGVAINKKADAREMILKILDQSGELKGRAERTVRVNSIDTGLADADLDVILRTKNLPSTILFPKVESINHADWIVDKLSEKLKSLPSTKKIGLIIYTESARGLLALEKICQTIIDNTKNQPFKLEGIVFGSDDFCADIGATRTSSSIETLYARQHVIVVAKAFGLQAVDMVHIDFKDLEGLRENSLQGARMGFTGKQVIHPGQVPVVQKAFSPSEERIKWAREMVTAFEDHQKSGEGAFTFHGQMIDMPSVLQAKNILKLADMSE